MAQNDTNRFITVGRVTKDVALEKRGGIAAATMCIATNRVWKDRATGEEKTQESYFYIDLLGQMATSLTPYLKKGKRVIVEGYFVTESYDLSDGNRRSIIVLKPQSVQLLDGGEKKQ